MAAALTLGMLSTAAAQQTKTKTAPPRRKTAPTKPVTVSKPETITRVDTVYRTDTMRITGPTVYRTDTMRVTVAGPTVTRWDTVRVMEVPGWLGRGNGVYFGLGAGPFYPSAGLGGAQIPGYGFQANLGVDPAGSPLGLRLTALLGRPDETQTFSGGRGRPSILNATADLKLRLPFFSSSRFPQFGLYGVGGLAYVRAQDVFTEFDNKTIDVNGGFGTHTATGWNVGGGATMSLGHKRELFLESRLINYKKTGHESNHQVPVILGINWY